MRVAIIQICGSLNYKDNLVKIDQYIKQAIIENQIEYFFLPEVFYSIGDGTKPTPYLIQKNNEHYLNIRALAVNNKVHLLGGTAATLENGKIFNRAYNFNPHGEEYPHYDKINLFAINSKATQIDESRIYSKGSKIISFDLKDSWKIGMSICFDIRFSSLFREHYKNGVNILTAASAFTISTGKAHWETLLRARAIEGQSYVVASAQVGEHNDKVKTYGHSMIISPWGDIIANAESSEGYIWANLDFDIIKDVRSRICMD